MSNVQVPSFTCANFWVLVKKARKWNDPTHYVCRQDDTGWRCGACLRGLVDAKSGTTCKVCGAVVL